MLIIELKNTKPVSTNHKTKRGKYGDYKSKEYQELIKKVNLKMMFLRDEIKQFLESYNHDNPLSAEFIFEVPVSVLFTKKDTLSKKSMDIDNCVKPLNDAIFKNLQGVDDAFIWDMRLVKKPSPDNNYNIYIKYFQ